MANDNLQKSISGLLDGLSALYQAELASKGKISGLENDLSGLNNLIGQDGSTD
jgi:hypothetical protein